MVRDSTPSLWPSLQGHSVCNMCMDLGLGFCDSVFVYLHLSPSLIINAKMIWQATTNSSAKSTSRDESGSSRGCGRRRIGCWKSRRQRQSGATKGEGGEDEGGGSSEGGEEEEGGSREGSVERRQSFEDKLDKYNV